MAADPRGLDLAGLISKRVSLFFCSDERLWVRIESDNIHSWMKSLDQDSKASNATADVEDPNPRLNRCLIEERFPRRLGTEQLHERVVERQQPIAAGGRYISFMELAVFKIIRPSTLLLVHLREEKSEVFPINNDLLFEQIRIISPQRSRGVSSGGHESTNNCVMSNSDPIHS